MKKENSPKTEYIEMQEFVSSLESDFLEQSDELLRQKKELEYKKRKIELILEDRNKKRNPNISMFSPLSTEDMYDSDTIAKKDEIRELETQIHELEEKWKGMRSKLVSIEQMKKFIREMESVVAYKDNKNISELTNYSVKLLETQELDRNRISRDLHDSTVQSLTSLIHKIEYCSKMIDKDPVCAKLELQSMIELNKAIINDMREIIYDLRPMALDNLGFIPTIESHCLHLQRNGKMEVSLVVNGTEKKLPSIVCVTLYRILQEACNNALKHSGAKHLWIRVSYKEDSVQMSIEDDGKGFDTGKKSSDNELYGFGLSTMKERAWLLNGTFSLISEEGSGTKIYVNVPVNYVDADDKYFALQNKED